MFNLTTICCKSWAHWSKVSVEHMCRILMRRLNGIIFLVWLWWQEDLRTYWCLSVGFVCRSVWIWLLLRCTCTSSERARANSIQNERARANSKHNTLTLEQQMFYYYQSIKKVNSYKERKNNSYNTETLLLSDCKMKLMKKRWKTKLLTKCWGRRGWWSGPPRKKPTSTNVVTLIDP